MSMLQTNQDKYFHLEMIGLLYKSSSLMKIYEWDKKEKRDERDLAKIGE